MCRPARDAETMNGIDPAFGRMRRFQEPSGENTDLRRPNSLRSRKRLETKECHHDWEVNIEPSWLVLLKHDGFTSPSKA